MKILMIKLGAKGDVVRTFPLAEGLKKKHPGAEITWITRKGALELFEGNPFVDKVFSLPFSTDEEFDILYNFDIEEEATSLASSLKAKEKYGFYSEGGYAASFNLGAEYYLNTIFDDELKKNNRKTYQEMMFQAADLPYDKEKPRIYLKERDKEYARDFVVRNGIDVSKLIGIHMGASPRWPSKAWSEENLKEFIGKAKKREYEILLFGGPDEVEKIKRFAESLRNEGIRFHTNDPGNSDREFASLVDLCKVMVCSDSFSLHVAMALEKPTIGLFFCTSPYEVETYGLLKRMISPKLEEFFPEKQDQYDEQLVKSIKADEVLEEVEKMIQTNKN